ncbi:transglycosylase SLT domain-containing protein [Nocardia africana]|uniref:Transglycosylase SLT domain n=1 Tax=Nocardia africana TaxID=134964 RepID=A0A378X419_9NOCA|nr:transglycosylase SLT domain-containing protein [Nocardia africana]MCC3317415.1 transglycosylase SLT domain-containing protein [Nocardia africana]SUA48168.1 Transglycosylase SLT domain [Nocardia africana]
MTGPGVALTIPDVEQWDPDKLGTAATAVGKLSGDLDQAVLGAVNSTQSLGHDQKWGGGAAQAAEGRMQLEKGRASAVSQAILGLQTALNQQVENLKHAKDAVLQMRNQATYVPAPSLAPPFEVNPDGTVNPQKRLDWLSEHRDKLNDIEYTNQTAEIHTEATTHEQAILRALQQAELVAEAAVAAVNGAKIPIDAAFAGLGDPVTGAGAAPPAPPAPTAPAAAAPPATPHATPVSSHSGTPASSSLMGNSHHGGGTSSYSGGSYGGGGSNGPTSGPPPTAHPSGDVQQWIAQAKQILIEMGYPPESIDENAIALIIEHESGGDPNAINNWDSNAAAGHPSKGLMQCIDSTFNAHAAPGHTDIWNPVDNIVAATRYSIDRYGSLDNVPGVSAVSGGGGYVGY